MKQHAPPAWLGKAIYIITRPAIWLLVRGTTRAYVVVVVQNEVLLTKNWLGLHKVWRLPGGGVHKAEDPKHAALRELQEEVGLTMSESDLIAVHATPQKLDGLFFAWLYIVQLQEKPTVHMNRHELISAEWLPIKNAHTIPVSQEVKVALATLK